MPEEPVRRLLTGPVEVIGTGLLGTSVALACRAAGIEVVLSDREPSHVRTASGLGAGRARRPDDEPQLVVVAVPPRHLGAVIVAALAESEAIVTDVGSVKSAPLARVREQVPQALDRYLGSHPMAGSERSGPLAASATLFEGRPWAITPHERTPASALALVEELIRLCAAVPVEFTAEEHDRAVARTSHVPHLMSALVAARLAAAPSEQLVLSGQGVRDVTRIAAGDPELYGQIVSGNATAVTDLLTEVRGQLDALIDAVTHADTDGLAEVLRQGVAGTAAIPGKHGGPVVPMGSVFVAVPDNPGSLARLFADAGESGVNVEDVRIDHDPGRPVGLVELVVAAERVDDLFTALEARDWSLHQ